MTAGSPATVLAGGVELLERSMGYTLGSLLLVSDADMSRPTPCWDWDLRALLGHMNDSLRTLDEAVVAGHLDLDPRGDHRGPDAGYGDAAADPVASLRNRACRMVGDWAAARGPTAISVADLPLTPGVVAAAGAVEVAVHGWDVARACGQDRPLPAALAEELLELCPLLVADADRPTRFADRVDLPPTAEPGQRLLAFLGRDPGPDF